MPDALDGIVVVDAAGSVATTYCGKMFTDYGATVVNLEPPGGFPTRHLAPFLEDPQSDSAMHAYLNANKQSVQCDALSKEALAALGARANLVLDDGSSDTSFANGLSMSISWYGKTGPYAEFVGSDAQCFALNGMLRSIGHPQGPPVIPTGYQAQIVGGLTAFVAAMGQVLGQELNPSQPPLAMHTSIFESLLCFTEVGAITAYNTGLEVGRMGINRFPPTYPMGVFPCKDGWIGITVLTPSQWSTFCQLLELQEFEGIDLFQSAIGRFEAVDILEPAIREKLLSLSCEELFYKAQRAALPLARVPTMDELFEIDQFQHRQAFADLELGSGRRLKAPTVPFRLFATPPKLGGEVAPLGADTKTYDL